MTDPVKLTITLHTADDKVIVHTYLMHPLEKGELAPRFSNLGVEYPEGEADLQTTSAVFKRRDGELVEISGGLWRDLEDSGCVDMAVVQAGFNLLTPERVRSIIDGEGKRFRNTFVVTVLSDRILPIEGLDLPTIAEMIDTGDCVGGFMQTEVNAKLTEEEMRSELEKFNSDPDFFNEMTWEDGDEEGKED